MKRRNGVIVALLFLATCNQETIDPSVPRQSSTPSSLGPGRAALGKIPASEVAVWQRAGTDFVPDGRYLQAAAFDETRKVVVIFGGAAMSNSTGTVVPNNEIWEWSPATGKWTNRTTKGEGPAARSGAAMVYDSARGKIVLFGGRAGSGLNYDDTWEWDPTTGAWLDLTAGGTYPSGRGQHGMVYEKSTGNILLFGGGRADPNSNDGTGVSLSLSDTWEYDPVNHVWTQSKATGPSARHDSALVWDGTRKKAVLFGGLQTDIQGAPGIPKQDTWEWDPAAGTWTERTMTGSKPSQRYGHASAFDGTRNKLMILGGWDISTGYTLNDLWEWDPTTGAWTERLTGNENGMLSPRMYSSMVPYDAVGKLELVCGAMAYSYSGTGGTVAAGGSSGGTPVPLLDMTYGGIASSEVWEIDPATPAVTNRSASLNAPSPRYEQMMAFYPDTGKTYVFGGSEYNTGTLLNDLWEFDGKV